MNTTNHPTPLPIKELCARATKGPWREQGNYVGADEATVCDCFVSSLIDEPKMLANRAYIARLSPETVMEVVQRLEKIAKWHGEFPESGRFWDEPANTRPVSFGAAYGSNGERDFMRSIANEAIAILNGLTPAQRDGKEE